MTDQVSLHAGISVPLERHAAERVAEVIAAIAVPVRIRILSLIATAPQPVSIMDLTPVVGVTQSTVSHHVNTLSRAGLINVERKGVFVRITLNAERFEELRVVFDLALGAKAKPVRRRR